MDTIYGALLMGGICGLGPIIVGALKKNMGLGIGGFFACVFSGLVLGILLAAPMCGIFIWLIIKKSDAPASLSTDTLTNTKQCPYCAEKILAEAKVCKHCNRELVKKCPDCGEEVNIEAKVCKYCNQQITTTSNM